MGQKRGRATRMSKEERLAKQNRPNAHVATEVTSASQEEQSVASSSDRRRDDRKNDQSLDNAEVNFEPPSQEELSVALHQVRQREARDCARRRRGRVRDCAPL